MTQVQCVTKDCPNMIIKKNGSHVRCTSCSIKRRKELSASYSQKHWIKNKAPRPIPRVCADCQKPYQTVNKRRKLCGDCIKDGRIKENYIPSDSMGPVHFGSGTKMPAERVWQQMLRDCR